MHAVAESYVELQRHARTADLRAKRNADARISPLFSDRRSRERGFVERHAIFRAGNCTNGPERGQKTLGGRIAERFQVRVARNPDERTEPYGERGRLLQDEGVPRRRLPQTPEKTLEGIAEQHVFELDALPAGQRQKPCTDGMTEIRRRFLHVSAST